MLNNKIIENPKMYVILVIAISFLLGTDFILIALLFSLAMFETEKRRIFRYVILALMVVSLFTSVVLSFITSNVYLLFDNLNIVTLSKYMALSMGLIIVLYIVLLVESFIGDSVMGRTRYYQLALGLPLVGSAVYALLGFAGSYFLKISLLPLINNSSLTLVSILILLYIFIKQYYNIERNEKY